VLSQKLTDFISVALSVDGGAADPASLKGAWRSGPNPARDEVEDGLRELLRTRELTVREYADMTQVDFDNEEELYDYLQKMYNYLFRGSEEAPMIPYPS
jgi:hypothetical protein